MTWRPYGRDREVVKPKTTSSWRPASRTGSLVLLRWKPIKSDNDGGHRQSKILASMASDLWHLLEYCYLCIWSDIYSQNPFFFLLSSAVKKFRQYISFYSLYSCFWKWTHRRKIKSHIFASLFSSGERVITYPQDQNINIFRDIPSPFTWIIRNM